MKGFCVIFVFSILFWSPTLLIAHDKVVVIPMGSPNIVGVYSQPYQYSSYDQNDINNPNTLLFTGESTEPVPAGKRLFVQHIFFRLTSTEMIGAPICQARVLNGGMEIVSLPVLMTKTQYSTDTEVATASQPIMLYADPGMVVDFACTVRVSADVTERFGVTGYFIDI